MNHVDGHICCDVFNVCSPDEQPGKAPQQHSVRRNVSRRDAGAADAAYQLSWQWMEAPSDHDQVFGADFMHDQEVCLSRVIFLLHKAPLHAIDVAEMNYVTSLLSTTFMLVGRYLIIAQIV